MPVEFIVIKERIKELFRLENNNIVYSLDQNKFVIVPRVYSKSWVLEDNGTAVVRELTKQEFQEIIERMERGGKK